ncbi:hypothetical protein ACQEU3_45775 [Spirillospora sp. CA-253888]
MIHKAGRAPGPYLVVDGEGRWLDRQIQDWLANGASEDPADNRRRYW